ESGADYPTAKPSCEHSPAACRINLNVGRGWRLVSGPITGVRWMTETIVGDGRWGLRPPRRTFLKAGGLGALGLSLPEWLAVEARATSAGRTTARARSVLVILEQGGMSHHDTWDPKPEWQAEHRSPFKPIATNVPGIRFTELLTMTARHA